MGSLRDYAQKVGLPPSSDLEKLSPKDLKAGEVFSRAQGNAAASPLDLMLKLKKTAEETGYKGKTDFGALTFLSDFIEHLYNKTPVRSGEGIIQRGVSAATNPIGEGVKALWGALAPGDEQAQAAFSKLLESRKQEVGSPEVKEKVEGPIKPPRSFGSAKDFKPTPKAPITNSPPITEEELNKIRASVPVKKPKAPKGY